MIGFWHHKYTVETLLKLAESAEKCCNYLLQLDAAKDSSETFTGCHWSFYVCTYIPMTFNVPYITAFKGFFKHFKSFLMACFQDLHCKADIK